MCEVYIVSIENLLSLLTSSSETAKKVLDFVPMGSNYCAIDYNGFDISFNKYDYYHKSEITIRQYLNLKYINSLHDVILTKPQFDDIEKTLSEDTTIEIIGYLKCIYDGSKTESYIFRMAISDLEKLVRSSNIPAQKLLDTIPKKVEIFNDKFNNNESNLDETKVYRKMYKSTMTLREHANIYMNDNSNHPQYVAEMSLKQFNDLTKAAFEDSNVKITILIIADKDSNVITQDTNSRRMYMHGSNYKDYGIKPETKKEKVGQCTIL